MDRVFNFSAGPSGLPLEILQQAQADMINYKNCGMSVMEMSHRSEDFEEIIKTAESDLRDLMKIPENYKVMFLQGGGTLQFSMVPLNLLRSSKKSGLYRHRPVGKKSGQRSAEVRRYPHCRYIRTGCLYLHTETGEKRFPPGRRLCVYHHQQYDLRQPLQLHPGYRGHRPRCGSVLQLPVGSI